MSNHPCERLNWESLYEQQMEAAYLLAKHGEYGASEDLWAATVGTRMELDHNTTDPDEETKTDG